MGILSTLGIGAGVIALLIVGGIIWGIGSSAGWWGNKHTKRLEAPKKERRKVAYLDTGDKLDPERIRRVIASYRDDAVLAESAASVEETFERTERRCAQIMSIVDAEFERGSLTWDRYSAPVAVAREAICANAAQIANLMQGLDSAEFARLERLERAGALEGREADERRVWVGRKTLAEIEELQQQNDDILAELDHLHVELQQMSGADLGGKASEIADEISRLAEEAHYYA